MLLCPNGISQDGEIPNETVYGQNRNPVLQPENVADSVMGKCIHINYKQQMTH